MQQRIKKQLGQKDDGLTQKCPVYLCKSAFKNEDQLLAHYNSAHKNLVDLGLKLIKSKESRAAEKKQKLKAQANKIVLNGGDDTKGKSDDESSYSEISNSENEDIYGGDFYGNSSEMEDLLELEKFEVERKNKAIQKRQLRRR